MALEKKNGQKSTRRCASKTVETVETAETVETVETVEVVEVVETVEMVEMVETVETVEDLKKYDSLTFNLKARDASETRSQWSRGSHQDVWA